MTDDQPQPAPKRRREHPILAGLFALVAVAVVVGAVVGGGALAATRVLGLNDEKALDAAITNNQTLFLPEPTDTGTPNEDITLTGVPSASTTPSAPESSPTKPDKEPPPISLSAAQTAVGPMEQIDLTGTYPAGEGAILRVQQFKAGTWTDFQVTASVSGGLFTTYIQTGATGPNRFRMIDTDNGQISNEVKVQIG